MAEESNRVACFGRYSPAAAVASIAAGYGTPAFPCVLSRLGVAQILRERACTSLVDFDRTMHGRGLALLPGAGGRHRKPRFEEAPCPD